MTTEPPADVIREGSEEEITGFPLYDDANEGEEILVVERAGQVVAYAMLTGNQLYFLESTAPGAGSALVRHLQGEMDELDAINCIPTAQGYWRKMGFEPLEDGPRWVGKAGITMRWYKD